VILENYEDIDLKERFIHQMHGIVLKNSLFNCSLLQSREKPIRFSLKSGLYNTRDCTDAACRVSSIAVMHLID
jgi:hypothetical protein